MAKRKDRVLQEGMLITTLFPVGYCASCERDVMLYHDLDDAGVLRQRCVHCDEAPTPRRADADAVGRRGAPALRKLGYVFDGDAPEPVKGCGKPNCGNGTCKRSGKPHPFAQ